MNERWLPIAGYKGRYLVLNLGRVSSDGRGLRKLRTLSVSTLGYVHLTLHANGKRRNFTVHRLVALAFKPTPRVNVKVDHIDRNKANNHATNLRWVTKVANQANRKLDKRNRSGTPGVCPHPRAPGEWRVYCGRKYVGRFADLQAACRAARRARKAA